MKRLAILLSFLGLVLYLNAVPINNESKDPMLGDFFEGDIAGVDKGLAQIPTSSYGKWPGGVVPYIIDPLTYDQNQTTTILSAMRLIEDQTRINGKDCIRFVPRGNEATYLRIFNGQGCWSYVGKQNRAGAQQVSLQKPTETNRASCIWKGTIAHELLHALGFWHEQSREDRDNFVKINWQNIALDQQHNFNKYTSSSADLQGFPYDYYSIMHYEWNAFSLNGQATVVALQSGIDLVNASKKNRNSTCFENNGLYPELSNCGQYYGCINFKYNKFFCLDNNLYDTSTKQCSNYSACDYVVGILLIKSEFAQCQINSMIFKLIQPNLVTQIRFLI
ncbi:unnamed protein product [Brachionus calyciflorus]|uniref:Metalloendopeptidase n=1 Tax=Brachionus calyciflorus TaxID=104777 RepID=A0A813ZAX7_9BILA|nr:unnamed protein product [Brachionus calyciflorus]